MGSGDELRMLLVGLKPDSLEVPGVGSATWMEVTSVVMMGAEFGTAVRLVLACLLDFDHRL